MNCKRESKRGKGRERKRLERREERKWSYDAGKGGRWWGVERAQGVGPVSVSP